MKTRVLLLIVLSIQFVGVKGQNEKVYSTIETFFRELSLKSANVYLYEGAGLDNQCSKHDILSVTGKPRLINKMLAFGKKKIIDSVNLKKYIPRARFISYDQFRVLPRADVEFENEEERHILGLIDEQMKLLYRSDSSNYKRNELVLDSLLSLPVYKEYHTRENKTQTWLLIISLIIEYKKWTLLCLSSYNSKKDSYSFIKLIKSSK